jgi:hypothetical protein
VSLALHKTAKAVACPAEDRVDCEAFMEASILFVRAAMHRFKNQYEHHNGWQAWWDSLLADPAVEFFHRELTGTRRAQCSVYVVACTPLKPD